MTVSFETRYSPEYLSCNDFYNYLSRRQDHRTKLSSAKCVTTSSRTENGEHDHNYLDCRRTFFKNLKTENKIVKTKSFGSYGI